MQLAVQGNPSPPMPFLWGDNGQQLTPQQAAAQQQVADAIMVNQRPPQTLGEGLNAVGQALLARSSLSRANASIQAGTQQAAQDLQSVLADPSKAASFLASDSYATDAQKSVAQAILNQQMMLTNPDMIAQRQLIASEVAKNQAETGMYANGGAAVGSPVQDANGNYYVTTQYGGRMRPLTAGAPPAGAPSAAPGADSAPALSVAPGTPASAPASILPPAGAPGTTPATPASTSAPSTGGQPGQFLTPAQQEQAKAKGQAEGTYQGNLVQNQQKAAQALEEQAIVNDSLLGPINPATGQRGAGLIDQAIAAASKPLATGVGGQLTEGISGTPGADLDALLSQIDANAAQKAIQDFRDSAPAGATGMRITQQEALIFGRTLSNISPHQSAPQLIKQLQTLKSQLSQISGGMQDSYARIYGSLPKVQTNNPSAYPDGYAVPFDPGGPAGSTPPAAPGAPGSAPQVTTPQQAAQFPVGTVVMTPAGPKTVTAAFKAQFGAQ